MTSDTFWMNLRYVLVASGMWIAAKSGVGEHITTPVVDLVVGLLITGLGAGWGNVVKWATKSVPAATGDRSDVPTVSSMTGAVEPAAGGRTV